MIGDVLNLTRWEWFKLRRRWMPWVLLVIMLLFSQLAVWGRFFSYNNLRASGGEVLLPGGTGAPGPRGQFQMISCNALEADPSAVLPAGASAEVIAGLRAQCQQQAGRQQQQLQDQYDGFTLPGSLSTAVGVAGSIGLVLLAVLTASTIGSDYGLGTLRPILARGTGRLVYLTCKFLMLITIAAGALLAVSVATAVSSWIAKGIAEAPPGGAWAPNWGAAVAALGKTWVSFIPYIVLTATMTVLTKSAAAGMGIGLGYYFAEGLLVALLSALFDWFDTVADYLLVRNINTFAGVSIRSFNSGGGSDVGLLQAGIILAVYTIALAGIAIRVFQQRDVPGASGG